MASTRDRLFSAIETGDADAARALLEAGADPDSRQSGSWTRSKLPR